MAKQRITYVPLEAMDDDMRREMERCQREGTPRPESSAVRAHVKACFWFFANSWRDLFKNGVLDHPVKELCRLYVSRAVTCEYCGNQRSVNAAASGMVEDDVRDLLQFERSTRYNEARRPRSPMPRPSSIASTPTIRSGRACTATTARTSWSSSAASSASRWVSRAGCGCSTSITTR